VMTQRRSGTGVADRPGAAVDAVQPDFLIADIQLQQA